MHGVPIIVHNRALPLHIAGTRLLLRISAAVRRTLRRRGLFRDLHGHPRCRILPFVVQCRCVAFAPVNQPAPISRSLMSPYPAGVCCTPVTPDPSLVNTGTEMCFTLT